MYYYNARYYDPQIGRFISADTIVQNPANPQTLNRYSYVLNNPLKYIDPSGRRSKDHSPPRWDIIIDPPFDPLSRALMVVCSDFEFYPENPWGITGKGYLDPDYLASLPDPVQIDEPVPIILVSEDSPISKVMNTILSGVWGATSLAPIGIFISETVEPEYLIDILLPHDLFHYWEQLEEGFMWYLQYGAELKYGIKKTGSLKESYKSHSDEQEAHDYATGGQPGSSDSTPEPFPYRSPDEDLYWYYW